ncbi:HAD family hydrolase [Trueperella bialowiezensis]|uniref:Phosphoglycolate phosphatase n=1 Tax=Trueperella bialowiezensis TaxID=312285 RepID=A0A3S5EW35_9ACTO|nr:HAD family hydrolase [Trueperella bialowiezensis]VEI13501.1 phosphoglycolate phosphatase [Trueperella bialowiezensis]
MASAPQSQRDLDHRALYPTHVEPGLPGPKGLLLDFGGVIVQDSPIEGWAPKVAAEIHKILVDADADVVDIDRIEADVDAGETAVKLFRDSQSRLMFPKEPSHEEYVLGYIAADWPYAAREAIRPHTSQIAYWVSDWKSQRTQRPGIADLLAYCKETGIPVAIVSNALCGQVHRDHIRQFGFEDAIAAEIYSDEYGIRKPNPELIWLGAAAIDCQPSECWYVGDHVDRDVLCGQRARVAASVLMPAPGAPKRPFRVLARPQVQVADPACLLDVLRELASN